MKNLNLQKLFLLNRVQIQMWKKSLMILFLCCSVTLFSQNVTISGVVLDENDQELTGVTVVVKGKPLGTVTDINGAFTLKVNMNDILVFSFLGYHAQEIKVIGVNRIKINMVPSNIGLDEVVVVGYGSQKRSHFAGAVSGLSVETERLDEIPVESLEKALQGRLAGVQILDTEGQVGVSPEIRIRGAASFNASNEPLVVIDGLPTTGSLSDVSMSDVANIEIMKDAASTAIYGSRGANGVIFITTKQGKKQDAKFSVKINMGMSKVIKYFDTYDIPEYARYYWNRDVIAPYETKYLKQGIEIPPGIKPDGTYESGYMPFEKFFSTELKQNGAIYNKYGAGYAQLHRLNEMVGAPDPQRAVTQTGHITNASMSAQGGTDKFKYYTSLNYSTQEGVMINNKYDIFSLSTNMTAQLRKNLRLDVKLNPRFSQTQLSANTQLAGALRWLRNPLTHDEKSLMMAKKKTGEGGVVEDWAVTGDYTKSRDFRRMWLLNDDLTDYVLDSKGNRITVETYSGTGTTTSYSDAMQSRDESRNYKLTGNLGLSWDILKSLTFRTTLGGYVNTRHRDYWVGSLKNSAGVNKDGSGSGQYTQSTFVNVVNENTLTYGIKFEDHQIDLLGGFSLEDSKNYSLSAAGQNYAKDIIQTLNYAGEIVADKVYNNLVENSLISFFGRVNYNYRDKYVLSLVMRTDGSSRFGPDNRWGTFPSISGAWRVTEEGFMKNIDLINDLKLRVSYGISGNNRIGDYAYTTGVNKESYIFGGSIVDGYAASGSILGNQALGWEQTNALNLGLSLSVLKSRAVLNIDVYQNKTRSLLLQNPVVSISGYDKEWDNIGKIEAKGIEVELNTSNIRNRTFSWSSAFTFTMAGNKLLNYGGTEEQFFVGYKESIYRLKVGRPIGEYYGYKTNGEIWKTDEEIDEAKQNGMAFENTVTGSLKYLDVNGDGKLTEDDRTAIGDPYPDFEWGITNRFSYKTFDLSFTFQGSHGAEVWNICNVLGIHYLRWMNEDRYIDEFHGNSPDPTKAEFTNSDYLVEDASFVALRDLTIGCKIPKVGMRLFFSGRNLLYFMSSDYKGINPEYMAKPVSGMSLITGEQRYNTTAALRSFNIGLDIKF